MNVVVVESPAKAKTINKYLGDNYVVLASYGHVRDLPAKDGSVKPDNDFEMVWAIDDKATKNLKAIADAMRGAENLFLATDPDREGEAIAWHVLEILKERGAVDGVAVSRVVFHEITKSAVLKAMEEPRDLDSQLIDAYLARRALDYLVGFTLSPVLWRKLPGARSAGRVQSVALRLVCQREREIEAFRPQEYWTVDAGFTTASGEALKARLTHLDGEKLQKFSLGDGETAARAKSAVENTTFTVGPVERKPTKRNPYPPFTTSTLQQEAARKLGFSARHTMQVAQRLYEGINVNGETVGLITYMRTDSISVAGEAVAACRKAIAREFGDAYVPGSPRMFKTKSKTAQEAHEAIRPTDPGRLPKFVSSSLDGDQRKLYDLVWRRTLASQMATALIERTSVDVEAADGRARLRANGSVIKFDGFLALYREDVDDKRDSEADDERRLPAVATGETLGRQDVEAGQHFTEPPPRFTEASLVKKLEELGIGRPSTYASTLSVLRDRKYVVMDKKRFVPEDKGQLVTAFLEGFFERYVQYDFTAGLEDQLDDITNGKVGWKTVLSDFWRDFSEAVGQTKDLRTTEVLDTLNEIMGAHVFPVIDPDADPRDCPSCEDGRLSLKVGKYGAFVGCSKYPDCRFTRQFTASNGNGNNGAGQDRVLGTEPESGLEVKLRFGRFGPYFQLGESGAKEKPKRVTLPKGLAPDEADLEKALALLSLPRPVGTHPETGKEITANLGRYGPYLAHDGKYASLSDADELFTVGVNRAVILLAESKPRGRGSSQILREIGAHPEDAKPVRVMDGRYGPYVTHNRINATLPKDAKPEDITMDQALDLIAAKAAKGKPKRKPARKKAAKKVAKNAAAD